MLNPEVLKESDKDKIRNPIIEANIISRLLLLWLRKFFKLGLKRPIEEPDIYETLGDHRSSFMGATFDRLWKRELIRHPNNPQFLRVISQVFGWKIFGSGVLYISLDIMCRYV